MEYRGLGTSGLNLSVAGLGCNNFGGRIDFGATQRVIHKALDLGVTGADGGEKSTGQNQSLKSEALALGPPPDIW